MKKLLMGAVILTLFAISFALVQTSCSKANAQNAQNITQLNKVAYITGWASTLKIWIANYDGTGAVQVPITLPTNVQFDANVTTFGLSVSPDGQKVFFTAQDNSGASPVLKIYSCDVSGANLNVVASGVSTNTPCRPIAF